MGLRDSRTIRPLLLAVIIFVILTLKDLLTEILGSKIGEFLQEKFGISTITLVYALVAVLLAALLFAVYDALKSKGDEEAAFHTGNAQTDFERLVESLTQRYQNRYEQKLDGRFEITLEVSKDWNSRTPRIIKERFSSNANIGEAVESINDAFEQKGRLLIVGNPGAGKTVLLLKLALNLLSKVNPDAKTPLPVIFNLASWSFYEYEKVEDWLSAILVSDNGLSKDFADTLLQQGRIFFLLDGLDELARNVDEQSASMIRAHCLKSLNDYLRYGRKAVICCRRDEFVQMYEATGQDAPVSAKVEVLDLTKAEVLLALQHAQQDERSRASATNLLKIVEVNELFLDVLSTPFYFTNALEIFDSELLKERDFPGDVTEIKKYLLESFTETKLYHTPNPYKFEPDKTKKWLKWLAQYIEKKQQVTFELADLQPSDVKRTFLSIIFIELLSGLIWRRKFNLRIPTEDFTVWTIKPLFQREYVGMALFICSISSITFSLGVASSGVTVVYGTLFGFLFGLFIVVSVVCRRIHQFAGIRTPYQRLKSGVVYNLLVHVVLLTAPVYFVLYWSIVEVNFYWQIYLTAVVLLGLIAGAFVTPLFRHLLIRLFLSVRGVMPYRYVTFLDYATSLRVLEKDGGQWRFRHQELQDYFARQAL